MIKGTKRTRGAKQSLKFLIPFQGLFVHLESQPPLPHATRHLIIHHSFHSYVTLFDPYSPSHQSWTQHSNILFFCSSPQNPLDPVKSTTTHLYIQTKQPLRQNHNKNTKFKLLWVLL